MPRGVAHGHMIISPLPEAMTIWLYIIQKKLARRKNEFAFYPQYVLVYSRPLAWKILSDYFWRLFL